MRRKFIRYFKNLWFASIGRNPYRIELDGLRGQFDKAVGDTLALKELYCKVLEQMDCCEKRLEKANCKLVENSKRLKSYQILVERLRERLNEKDMLLGRVKTDYQQRLNAYNEEISNLRDRLKQVAQKQD